MSFLSRTDPEISQAIECDKKRVKDTINLIASENYTSRAVLEAQGSFLNFSMVMLKHCPMGHKNSRFIFPSATQQTPTTLSHRLTYILRTRHRQIY